MQLNMRNKQAIFLLFLFSLYSSLHAIDIDGKGINLGLNYTKLWGNVQKGSDLTPGFTIGGFVNKKINNWLIIQPELHLTSKIVYRNGEEKFIIDNDKDGSFNEDEYDLIDNDEDGLVDEDRSELTFFTNGHYQLYYLEIPILFKTTTHNSASGRMNFIFGPSFNFLLSGKYTFHYYGRNFHSNDLSSIGIFDLEIICGVEYNFGDYSLQLSLNQGVTENKYNSAGEVMMNTIDNYEEFFGSCAGDDFDQYCRYKKVSGYDTSVTLLLSINL